MAPQHTSHFSLPTACGKTISYPNQQTEAPQDCTTERSFDEDNETHAMLTTDAGAVILFPKTKFQTLTRGPLFNRQETASSSALYERQVRLSLQWEGTFDPTTKSWSQLAVIICGHTVTPHATLADCSPLGKALRVCLMPPLNEAWTRTSTAAMLHRPQLPLSGASGTSFARLRCVALPVARIFFVHAAGLTSPAAVPSAAASLPPAKALRGG